MYKFKSLKDHVYDYIADQILQGNLLPNEKISENKICLELNISRTPVREALIQLSSEGILENVPRKGFVLKTLDPKEAEQIYEVIGVLDGFSAKLACINLTPKVIKDMEFYIESMDLAISTYNYEMYYKQQEIFHKLYLDLCGNPTLIYSIVQLKNKFLAKSYNFSNSKEEQKILYNTNEEHKYMIELFKEKKADELETYIRDIHWHPEKADTELTDWHQK